MKKLGLALVTLALSTPAFGYNVSCGTARDLLLEGGDGPAIVAGYAIGAIDQLAGLFCFVGEPACICLQNVVGRSQALAEAYANEIVLCASGVGGRNPNDGLWGSASRAAGQLCSF